MKTNLVPLSLLVCLSSACLITCTTPAEKVDAAERNVEAANNTLDEAEEAYLQDIENYKIETAEKIKENEERIEELKSKRKDIKKENRTIYDLKIKKLEQKNEELKSSMENYHGQGSEKWETFKAEFGHDMEELGKAFNGLVKDDVK